jgi:hypothetical protein
MNTERKITDRIPFAYTAIKYDDGTADMVGVTLTTLGAQFITGDGTLQNPLDVKVNGAVTGNFNANTRAGLENMEHADVVNDYMQLLAAFNILSASIAQGQHEKREVRVRSEQRHGTYYLYPMNPLAQVFAELTGTKTIPWRSLDYIKALGFRVLDIGHDQKEL